jgi:recombination protein RecA
MAKKKEHTDDDLFKELAEETGGEIIGDTESVGYFIDTGNLAINFICSGKYIKGGIPGNRITEVYGPSSSGKSLLAANVLHGCQKLGGIPAILDCENATNAEFMARVSHLNLKQVLRYEPFTIEQAFLKIYNVVKKVRERTKRPIVFIYDSIAVSPCEREFKESNLPENYKAADWKRIVGRQEQPGERAKICGKELRKLLPFLQQYDVTLMVLNQIRNKIGVLYGSPETTAGGGAALEFYASCRLRTATRKKIENKKLDTFAGVNMHIKNVKNRTHHPFMETSGVQMFFQTGVNPLTGLLTSLIQSERIDGKAGKWKVNPDYLPQDRAEYKFSASKETNIVPLQVLLDCPKLVDAESTEELQKYLEPFALAMNASLSDDYAEKPVAYDHEGNMVEGEESEEE